MTDTLLEARRFLLRFRHGGRLCEAEGPVEPRTEHGPVRLTCRREDGPRGACLTWRIETGEPVELVEFFVEAALPRREIRAVFANGFQSWTQSRELGPGERLKSIRRLAGDLLQLKYYGDYHFHRYPGRPGCFHSYTYTYARLAENEILFLGSLSEEDGYTLFEWDLPAAVLVLRRDCAGTRIRGSYRALSVLAARGPEEAVFDAYAASWGLEPRPRPPVTGWTSWYRHYTRISERILLADLDGIRKKEAPFDFFQVDDGYQQAVGDWLEVRPGFPGGLKLIADRARQAGYTPGLWLAPFACEKRSRVFRDHPQWVLRDGKDRPVPAGWNPGWSGTFYALDPLREEARAYLRNVFRTVFETWGYGLVKLDFLYAAALRPRGGRNRGQIMAEACRFLRECAGNNLILGCGVPLGSCFGLFDYCRIGSDVALKWEDRLLGFFRYRERVSTVNSLLSTVGRRHLGGRMFGNDPDVFILRESGHTLTTGQKQALFLLNGLFGQLLFTSDDVGEYGPEQMERLRWLSRLREKRIHSVRVDGRDVQAELSLGRERWRLSVRLERQARVEWRRCDSSSGAGRPGCLG